MTDPAEVTVEGRDRWIVGRVTGEVDTTNASRVGDELTREVANEADGLVVDLSRTPYIDSAAIGILFGIARRLRSRRQALRLVVPSSSPLVRVLEITEVRTVASLHETVEGALGDGP